ncbi:MAG: GntG family PLP-dependent aldolase [Bythopirellula sp.]|nr:GntG family PLP-dependent aldolase [Bythopirellula sp.]
MKGVSATIKQNNPVRIDLLSDTITRPTPGMRAAMAAADVGDDVFSEDPTTLELEARIARMLGKEAALFMPSGTMSNLIGLLVHCLPGDEFICDANCHIFNYEQAGYAQVGGLGVQPICGEYGVLTVDQLRDQIRGPNDHLARTRLVCLEQTHNRAAGRVLAYEGVVEICAWASAQGLASHLDGARLFNAVVASGISANDWAQHFDTVSVCFSKGLGAPVGSALCGPLEKIKQARRRRKMLGGGMRQIGSLAAAALYALEHHVERLSEDHEKAQLIAAAVRENPQLALISDEVDTNIVIFTVAEELGSAAEFCQRLLQGGIRLYAIGPQKIRAVTHLDVTKEECAEVAEMLRKC